MTLLDVIHAFVCQGEKQLQLLTTDWKNATSFTDIAHATHCAQHIYFSSIPAIFLFLGSLVIGCLILIVCHSSSFFHSLFHPSKIDDLSTNQSSIGDAIQLGGSIVVFILTIACRNRGVGASGVLFCYWLLVVLLGFPEFRFSIVQLFNKTSSDRSYNMVVFSIAYIVSLINFILSCFADHSKKNFQTKRSCPELYTSFLNQITFNWFNDMAILGNRKSLERDDLWDLNERDRARTLIPEFDKHFLPRVRNFLKKKEASKYILSERYYPSILIPLFLSHKWTTISGALYKFIFDLLQFVAPALLNSLISFIQTPAQNMFVGIIIALSMFFVTVFQSMILHQYFHSMFRMGMNIRTVLTNAVYRKALNLSNTARKNRTTGEIVNLMSIDIQRLQDMATFVMLFWSSPLQVILSIFFLYKLLGFAVIAGLFILFAMIPFNGYISILMRNQQMKQMKFKDERLKLMSEILNGMKVLKLYSWEQSMQNQIQVLREKEIGVLRRIAYLNALTSLSWACAPFLVAVITFGLYVKIDPSENILTPQITFVALSLFNILRFPLAVFSMIFSQAVQCSVSNNRLKAFFAEDEMDPNTIQHSTDHDECVRVEDAAFGWDNSEVQLLKNINLNVKRGELVAIVGKVGSGKSSLLSALLGEMTKQEGKVIVNGDIAYVPQQPWIQNLTLRDNILFNKPMEADFYEKVVKACALQQDLSSLPAEDLTEIGEKGINLSGGQKQRVSLARAVYSGHDVVFLDDPLSAVDAHVGKHIFEHVISSTSGMLRDTTRILVTHGIHFLKHCDRVVVLKDGEISESGTYRELLARQGPFSEFIEEFLIDEVTKRGRSVSFGEDGEAMEEILSAIEKVDPQKKKKLQTQLSMAQEEREAAAAQEEERSTSPPGRVRKIPSEKEKIPEPVDIVFTKGSENIPLLEKNGGEKKPFVPKGKIIEKEAMETGKVKWTVYSTYVKSIGFGTVLFFCAVYIVSSVLGVFSNIWLANWSDDAVRIQSSPDGASETNKRLLIYMGLGLAQALTICTASVIMALGMVKASRTLHTSILGTTLHAPMAFLDVTPIGRIINRFGKDIDAIDSALPNSIRSLLITGMAAMATLVVVVFTTPHIIAPLIGLAMFYYGALEMEMLDSKIPNAILSFVGSIVQAAMILSVPLYTTPWMTVFCIAVLAFYGFILDCEDVDTNVPRATGQFIRTFLASAEIIGVIVFITPTSTIGLLPLFFVYYFILRFYVSTSRQLKRLDSTTRSPIFSHFQESIQGATSIRAYRVTDKFIDESSKRVDENLATYYPSIVANRWLAVRLELVGNLIVFLSALFAVWYRDSPTVSAGLVGLSVSYALSITQTLNWAVRMTSELETNIVAVERINEYAAQQVEGLPVERNPEREDWPNEGVIEFKDFKMRYRPGLDLVLKGVTAHIGSGQKVGIVGRTGAGKSSLTLALFRIVEADSGYIEIDGERIDELNLHMLRSRLTIVPQDPVLFSGSLRDNLDPAMNHTDDEVWEAIRESHLEVFIRSLPDGLDHTVSEGGENLSVGQRQLLCLARALLRKSKILILDEAAAAVDMETDSLIQKAIREQFKECTVLTIAHRLNTIMDYDLLFVMEDGKIVESDSPEALMKQDGGIFRSMAVDAGLVKEHED